MALATSRRYFFASGLSKRDRFRLRSISGQGVSESHLASGHLILSVDGLRLPILKVRQPELGHSEHVGLEVLRMSLPPTRRRAKYVPNGTYRIRFA